MKWILFTGTWRYTNEVVENDVRKFARDVIARGDGIVTGGATGVDYFAMSEALKIDQSATQIKVIIPADLESYCTDYYTNWCLPPVTVEVIDNLKKILYTIKSVNPDALIEMPFTTITQEHYNLRHIEEVTISDEVYAFQVNESSGTQDTINKAQQAGLPIAVYKKYTI